mmetsp:Transcript_9734/g.19849  ORF Transcript_9734/g.19849 Transcript_9734/m.19849 type:complete len:88 (-) Transcript_9734:483-746(-)
MSKLDSIFQHIGLEVDPTIVSQVLTFLFTTFVIVINVRAVLLRLTKLFSFVSANTAMSGTVRSMISTSFSRDLSRSSSASHFFFPLD